MHVDMDRLFLKSNPTDGPDVEATENRQCSAFVERLWIEASKFIDGSDPIP